MCINIWLLVLKLLKLLTSFHLMHLIVLSPLTDQMVMDGPLVPLLGGSACLGFVHCLSIVLLNSLSVLLHVLLILLLSHEQVLNSSLLSSLLTDQQRFKRAFLPCLLLKSLLHEQILLFLLIEAVQVQNIMNAAHPVLAFGPLSFLAYFTGLGVYLGDEGKVLNFLGLLFHLFGVDLVIEADFSVDEFGFEGVFVRAFEVLGFFVDLGL